VETLVEQVSGRRSGGHVSGRIGGCDPVGALGEACQWAHCKTCQSIKSTSVECVSGRAHCKHQ
jgi:hypothetical protein